MNKNDYMLIKKNDPNNNHPPVTEKEKTAKDTMDLLYLTQNNKPQNQEINHRSFYKHIIYFRSSSF